MHGLEHDAPEWALSDKQVSNLNNHTRGMTPFQVRNASDVRKNLGSAAIVKGFISVPIKTSIQQTWNDDLDMDSCGFVKSMDSARWEDERTYKDVMWQRDALKDAYKVNFDLNQTQVDTMTFH